MKTYSVIFAPEANEQLLAIYRHIADTSMLPDVAADYVDAIINHCEGLSHFPFRGTPRDDIRPGLRITPYRKRVVIAYAVQENQVSILGVFYGGQNYEFHLEDDA